MARQPRAPRRTASVPNVGAQLQPDPGDAHAAPSRARARFDLGALGRNLAELERRTGRDADVIASVKADAYGHGAVPVARALASSGVFALATGSLGEAIEMRQAGVESRVLLFPGFLPDAIPSILEHDLTPAIDRLPLAQALSSQAPEKVSVWLKLDAGLGRHGVALEDAVGFATALSELPRIELEGVFTHLPFVDEAGRAWAEARVAAFGAVLQALAERGIEPRHTQALSSAGALAGIDDPTSAICPGHALYGIAPAGEEVVALEGLAPVARSIATRISHVRVHAGARRIGVGGARSQPAGTTTAVVSIGRRDGYRWHADQPAVMLVAGRRAPVIGLSLEHVMLDLTGIPDAEPGHEAVVLGAQGDEAITLAELAAWRRSSPVETLLDFAGRITRDYEAATIGS